VAAVDLDAVGRAEVTIGSTRFVFDIEQ